MTNLRWTWAAIALLACRTPAAAPPAEPLRGAAPDWVSGDSLEYPRPLYVTGVGVADDRPTAEERARAEIARVFSVKVSSTTTAAQAEATAAEANGRAVHTSSASASDETRTTTDKVMEGTEIVATWSDAATRRTYALAALHRRKAITRVRAQLDPIDARAGALEGELARAARPADAAVPALRILALARPREQLAADLRVLDPGADEGAAAFQRAATGARAALGKLTVTASTTGDLGPVLDEGLSSGLAAVGLRPVAAAEGVSPDLTVETTVGDEDLGKRDGWFWWRTSVAVTVREVRSGKALVTTEQSAREAATQQPEARRRAAKSAAARVADGLPAALLSWAER